MHRMHAIPSCSTCSCTSSWSGCGERRGRPPRADAAPATPTRRASSSATACASSTRSTGTRRRRSCSSRRRRSRTRGSGRPDPVPLAPLPRGHVRPARQRPVRPSPRRSGVLLAGVRRRRSGRAGGERRPGRARGRPLRRWRLGADARRDRSGDRARRGRDRAVRAPADTAHPNYTPCSRPTSRSTPTRAGRSATVHYWRRDYRGFLEFFFASSFPEPHSTKQIEDCVRWGLEGGAESLILADEEAPPPWGSEEDGARHLRARPLPRARDPRRPRQLPDRASVRRPSPS